MNSIVRELLENAREDRLLVDDLAGSMAGRLVGLSHAVAVCLGEGWLVEVFVEGALEAYELTSKGAEALEKVEREDE